MIDNIESEKALYSLAQKEAGGDCPGRYRAGIALGWRSAIDWINGKELPDPPKKTQYQIDRDTDREGDDE